jgi:pyruvate dehydrogenase E1 component beta subunit
VPGGDHLVPFGQARVAREGRHATVVAYANAVPMAVEAADRLAQEGVSVEVIDLRTLVPWDWRTVLASVEKTGRLLVATEASRTASFASVVAATVAELAVAELDAPILRVSAPDAPVPAEKGLEAFHRPNTERIVEALRTLTHY